MTIKTAQVQHILEDLVKTGSCKSKNQAQRELASKLAEIKLDQNIAEARKDYKNGKYETLNDDYINKFTAKLKTLIL